jgi:hypothetical protein
MLHRVDLVRTDVSEELSASFTRVTRIDELGTTLAVTSNRRTLRRIVVRMGGICAKAKKEETDRTEDFGGTIRAWYELD